MNYIKKLFLFLTFSVTTSTAFAQEVQKPVDTFKINLSEQVSFFNLESDTITKIDTSLGFDILDNLNINLSLPVYNDNNTTSSPQEIAWQLNNGIAGDDGTGLGDGIVQLKYSALRGIDVFGTKSGNINLIGGVQIPLDGEFSSSDFTYFGGLEFNFTKDKINFSQDAKYFLVDDYTYNPYLGGFVGDDIIQGETSLTYSCISDFNFGVHVTQVYSDGQKAVLVGPVVEYSVTNNLSLEAGLGFAVVDDLKYDNLDTVLSFGLGFKF